MTAKTSVAAKPPVVKSNRGERKRWSLKRKALRLDDGFATIEYVPGGAQGERAYFWIGIGGRFVATVDARTLARFVDGLRSKGVSR